MGRSLESKSRNCIVNKDVCTVSNMFFRIVPEILVSYN